MRKNLVANFLLMLAVFTATAQDFHLSQYDMAPHYMNPALTGMYGSEAADYKIYSDYRAQWSNATMKPFSTAYLAYDMKTPKWSENLGVGAYLINNHSGFSSMNTFSFMLSAAYNITAGSGGKHLLTTGLQAGLVHKGFDPDKLTYDAQYSETMGGFDSGLPSGESYRHSSVTGFDANYGVYYKYTEAGRRFHPFGGFSIYHLARPNESFTANKVKTPMRFNVHGGCDIGAGENLVFTPRFLYMNEAKVHELNVGLLTRCSFPNSPYAALLQLDCRGGDAFIMGIGISHKQHAFRISYDLGTSNLGNYLDGNGSWEFSLVLTGIKGKPLFGGGAKATSDLD